MELATESFSFRWIRWSLKCLKCEIFYGVVWSGRNLASGLAKWPFEGLQNMISTRLDNFVWLIFIIDTSAVFSRVEKRGNPNTIRNNNALTSVPSSSLDAPIILLILISTFNLPHFIFNIKKKQYKFIWNYNRYCLILNFIIPMCFFSSKLSETFPEQFRYKLGDFHPNIDRYDFSDRSNQLMESIANCLVVERLTFTYFCKVIA